MTTSSHVEHLPAAVAGERLPVIALLDTEFIRTRLEKQVREGHVELGPLEIEHVRYIPRVSAVVSYRASYRKHGDELSTRLYTRACTAEAFPRAQERLSCLRWTEAPLLSAPISCPKLSTFMLEFPNDTRLNHLGSLQPKPLCALLARMYGVSPASLGALQSRLLRYKPEARCVVEIRLADSQVVPQQRLVMRLERPDKSVGAHRNLARLQRLLSDDEHLGVPSPLLAIEAQGLSAVEWVDGDPLSDRLSGEHAEAELRRVGAALGRLHRLPRGSLPHQEASSYLVRARRSADHLGAHAEQSETVEALMRALLQQQSATTASPNGVIHGDFHQGQVVCRPERLWFLDLDRVCSSEVAVDVGNFLAHLQLLSLKNSLSNLEGCERAFWAGYEHYAGFNLDAQRVRLFTALGLLELAAKQFRRLRPDWPKRVSDILRSALQLLEAGARA